MRSKLVIGGLAVLAVFAIACGAGSGKTESSVGGEPQGDGVSTPQGPATAALGQTVTLTNEFLNDKTSVDVTLSDAQQHTTDSLGLSPDNGVFLVVQVTVVCNEGTYHANPFNFKFVGPDGTVYEHAFASFDGHLNATDLNAGQRVAGNIVFDVPPAAIEGGKIQMDGIGLDFDEAAAYWTL
ncbi:MAG: DUF4352 domain-containing protein [Micromonosporaceae bacterium]|nr:DUF4352 domain-containing protein [Micromonosporaceae bacterium]